MNSAHEPTRSGRSNAPDQTNHRAVFSFQRKTLPIYALSYLFLAALTLGFILRDLHQAYQDTLAYWNARMSNSAVERVSYVALWLNERRTDTMALANHDLSVGLLSTQVNNSTRAETRRQLEWQIQSFARTNGFLGGAATDTECRIMAQSGVPAGATAGVQETCREVLGAGDFSTFITGMQQTHVWLYLAYPIFARGEASPPRQASRRKLGAMVMIAEPWKPVLPFLSTESESPGATETLIVWNNAHETVIFSPQLAIKGVKSLFRRPLGGHDLESRAAREDRVDFDEFTDYRGGRVFGAAQPIGAAEASLVRKVDRDTALAAYHQRSMWEWLAGGVFILFLGSVIAIQHRHMATRDLKEKLEQQQALLELTRRVEVSAERFRELVESVDAIVWEADAATMRITFVSRGAEKILGYSSREWVETPSFWADHIHPEDRERALACERTVLEKGEPMWAEYRMRAADGRYLWFRDLLNAAPGPDGKAARFRGVMVDITEHKRMEDALRQSEARFRSYFELPLIGMAVTTSEKKWIAANHRICDLLGYPLQELIQTDWSKLTHPDDLAADVAQFNRVLAGEIDGYSLDKRFIRKSGEIIWTSIAVGCVRKPDRTVDYICAVMQDITDRKRAEAAVRESEARFRTLIERAPVAIGIGRNGLNIYANQKYLEMFGIQSVSELVGQPIAEQWAPESRELIEERALKRSRGLPVPEDYEAVGQRRDGHRFPVHINITMVNLPDGPATLGFLMDITERKRAEEALAESRALLDSIINSTSDWIWSVDADASRLLWFNESLSKYFLQAFGIRLEKGMAREKLLPTDDLQRSFLEFYQRALREGSYTVEYPLTTTDKTLQLSFNLLTRAGAVFGVSVFGKDITGRKRMEEALRQSEERYRLLFERSLAGIFHTTLVGDFIDANDACASILGYTSREKLLEHSTLNMYCDVAERQALIARVQKEKRVTGVELHLKRQDGSPVCVLANVSIIEPSPGGPAFLEGTFIDITERKRAEEELRLSEEKFHKVFHASPDIAALVSLADDRIVEVNERVERTTGYAQNELVGKTYRELQYWPDPAERDRLVARLRREGTLRDVEVRLLNKSREMRTFTISADIIVLRDGEYMLSILRDITDQKRGEEALRESEERFRTTFETAGIGMALVDLQGHPVQSNPALQRILGYSAEELGRMAFTEFTHPGDREMDWRLYRELMEGKHEKYEIEKRYIAKDGKLVWGHLTISLVKDLQGRPQYAVGMLEDITERKRAEDELRASEAKFRALAETAPAAVFIYQGTGIRYANPAMGSITGFSQQELLKMNFWDFVHPDEREMVRKRGMARQQGQPVPLRYEIKTLTRDGGLRWVDFTDGEFYLEGKVAIVGMAFDITDRKRAEEELSYSRAELRALAARLQSAQEIERARIAREIHDELGQVLTGLKMEIVGIARKLRRDQQALREKTAEAVRLIDSSIGSVRKVAAELRPGLLDSLGLEAAIEWQLAEFQSHTGVSCKLVLPERKLALDHERAIALYRILQESLTNVARHARAHHVEVHLTQTNGDLLLDVKDDGQGFQEAKRRTALSLGIAGMRERVLMLGGTLEITSQPGSGTAVRVSLPWRPPAPVEVAS